MSDLLQLILSVIGGVGGLIGMWAAVATFKRDRAQMTIELQFNFQNSPDAKSAQVIGRPGKKAYYLTSKIRNVGYRPVFLEEIRFEYGNASKGSGITSLCELVLDETRRSHTVHYDLDTGIADQLTSLVVVDHRGLHHRVSLRASRLVLWLYSRLPRVFRHETGARLHAIKSLRDYYVHPKRDPYDLRRYTSAG